MFTNEEASVPRVKCELDIYLDKGCVFARESNFDVVAWWKDHLNNYHLFSRIVKNILVVPITTITSKTTFIAGS